MGKMPNFPLDRLDKKEWIIASAYREMEAIESFDDAEFQKKLDVYRHPFILALIQCGVLPSGIQDFRIDCPLGGVFSITARYLVDKESFEEALRKLREDQ